MNVKILRTLSGADGVKRHGTEHEFPDDEAARLIAAGIAEAVDPADAKKVKAKLAAVPEPEPEKTDADEDDDESKLDDGKDDADEVPDPAPNEEDPDKDAPGRLPTAEELHALTRPVLNAAASAAGVDEPEKLANKAAVVDAILAAREAPAS